MLLLKFLQRKIRSGLIVTHIIIPRLRKLQELRLLRRLNILQFLLLGGPDVVLLAYCFFPEQLVELSACLFGLLVVPLDLALLPVLLQQPQEVEHLVVGGDVDDAVGGGLPNKILPVQIVRIVFGELFLDLLHQFNELIKRNIFRVLVDALRLPDLRKQRLGLLWITLQALHNGLQVRQFYCTLFFFVEEEEYFLKILDFFW